MEDFFIKAAQLILSLSILVILHELGHFIPAKLFGTRVEKFYLFFNPWFSLFKIKKGETEYGIGWLPLGGYVKIAGMIDESMDKEQMEKPPEPWEFRSKPAWQRLIIMVGGVSVNLILGILIYAMILFVWGEQKLPNQNLKDGVFVVDSMALNMGFRNGDKIITVNNKPVHYFEDIMHEMFYAKTVEVERKGQKETINIPQNFIEQFIESKNRAPLFLPRMPAIVADVPDTSAAKIAGLKTKDRIISLNGSQISYFDELRDSLNNHKGEKITLGILREEERIELPVNVSSEGKIGFMPGMLGYEELERLNLYEFDKRKESLLGALPAGYNKATETLASYVRQMKLIFTPSTGAYKGIGGFGSIGGLFPAQWNWQRFWEITALLSIILAFMNILPIPALDGGHIMFLLYEVVTRRKPNEKFMEYAQYAGMMLLLALMLYANGNDVLRLFK